jgi:hypothetical protein
MRRLSRAPLAFVSELPLEAARRGRARRRRIGGGRGRRLCPPTLAEIRNLGAAGQHLRDERGERAAIAAGAGIARISDQDKRPRGLLFTIKTLALVAHARTEQVRGQILPLVNTRPCIISKHS